MTAGGPLTVSIVTPSFNQGSYIAETVASVLEQDYPSIDHRVLDAGSTDGTLDVLRGFGNRVRWISEPDRGQSDAINKGWRLARGEILTWLNADDLYRPGAVRAVAAFFEAYPDVDVVYGDCDYIDPAGRLLRPYPTRPYDYLELIRGAMNFIPQPATFIRRRVVEDVGLLDEGLHYVMDLDYWLRAGIAHRVAYLPQKLAALRLHPDAKSIGRTAAFAPELVRVYQRLFTRADLPPAARALEQEAMSNIHYVAATQCFWEGDPDAAADLARAAWRHASGRRRQKLLLLIGLSRLGRVGLAAARGVRSVLPRPS